jgi:glycosyltransferase involved in cell wall biosynthesis
MPIGLSKMKNNTKVSVVIPAYNAEGFIEDSVKSCFNQTHKHIETIVVNDGSTDATARKVRDLADLLSKNEFKLKLINVGKNMGAANALKVGFTNSEGTYICWLSADDVFIDSQKIEKQVSFMEKNLAAWSYFRDYYAGTNLAHAKLVRSSYLPRLRILNPLFLNDSDLRLMALFFRNPINGSSIMINRKLAGEFGMFDPITRNVDADGDLWMRYSVLNLKLAALKGAAVFNREHSGQTSKRKTDMLLGSELTRVRMLIALKEKNRLKRFIKKFVPFFPIIIETKCHLNRPFTSEFLFNYILTNRDEFNFLFGKYIRKSLNDVKKRITFLALDKDKFERALDLFRSSKAFQDFENWL